MASIPGWLNDATDARYSGGHQSGRVKIFMSIIWRGYPAMEGVSGMQITTIGINLAKNVFKHMARMNAVVLSHAS